MAVYVMEFFYNISAVHTVKRATPKPSPDLAPLVPSMKILPPFGLGTVVLAGSLAAENGTSVTVT